MAGEQRRREDDLRREVVQVCRLMYRRGLIAATDGNVSVRVGAGLLLTTPSGLCKGLLEEGDLVVTDMEGRVVEGRSRPGLRPSAEIRMHLEIYRQRPDVCAVVHAHPPVATALVTIGTIVTTAYATPTSARVPEVVREPIRSHDALVLDRHGAVTVGRSVLEAYARMEKVENTAQVLATARMLGRVQILPLDEIRVLVAARREHVGDPARALPDCRACGACEGLDDV